MSFTTPHQLKPVLAREEIEKRIKGLSLEISQDYAGLDLVLIGVLNGVFMFMSDLAKDLTIPACIDFVRLASYGAGMKTSGRIVLGKDLDCDLAGRHALIVEDIADSGITIDWLKKHIAEKGAASVKVCVLVDKLERRDVAVRLDYVGFQVEQGFLVGYGMDYNGQYRCLPDIYHLILS